MKYTTKIVLQKQQLYVVAYLVDFVVTRPAVGQVSLLLKFQTVVSLLEAYLGYLVSPGQGKNWEIHRLRTFSKSKNLFTFM